MITMKEENSWYCPLPFIHLEIQPVGDVFVCCHSLSPQKLGNLHEQTLRELWDGATVEKFQDSFKKNQGYTLDHCKSCRKLENESAISGRQREEIRWKDERVNYGEIRSAPLSLAIRYSNLCNLKCRTCKPSTSTSWFTDAKKMSPDLNLIKLNSAPVENPISNQIKWFLENGLRKVYFAGGEALLEEDHYKTLDQIIEINPNIEISYDTNFSILGNKNNDIIKYWSKLSNIIVSASIDGSFKKGEYLRKGLSWSLFVKNWNTLEELCPHVMLKVHCTISIYNVYHLLEFLLDIDKIGSMQNKVHIDIGFCEDPIWLNIRCLPLEIKKEIRERYNEFLGDKANYRFSSILSEILSYMKIDYDIKYFLVFNSYTKKLDDIRDEKFSDIFPYTSNMINRYMKSPRL